MDHCKTCGAAIPDDAHSCPECGTKRKNKPPSSDYGGFGWMLLGFCIPIIGLILYLYWKESRPVTARALGTGAVVSLAAAVLWYFFTAVLGLHSVLL